jgi:23S rRNA (guanine745-N1)-methyltransferase
VSQPRGLVRHLDLLCCPSCGGSFRLDDRALRCPSGHSFDLAREGYVNLTLSSKKAGDAKEMVAARSRFLATGSFDPLLRALAERVTGGEGPVIDVGCGPGFYLQQLTTRCGFGDAVGIDLSKVAVRAAARAMPGVAWVVADVTQGIPVGSERFGVVLSVFSPRPVAEFRRIVRGDGRLVIVAAGPRHLQELREAFGLLDVPSDKEEMLRAQLDHGFDCEIDRLTFPMDLGPGEVGDLIAMGPNYRHDPPEGRAMDGITADFVMAIARPR